MKSIKSERGVVVRGTLGYLLNKFKLTSLFFIFIIFIKRRLSVKINYHKYIKYVSNPKAGPSYLGVIPKMFKI